MKKNRLKRVLSILTRISVVLAFASLITIFLLLDEHDFLGYDKTYVVPTLASDQDSQAISISNLALDVERDKNDIKHFRARFSAELKSNAEDKSFTLYLINAASQALEMSIDGEAIQPASKNVSLLYEHGYLDANKHHVYNKAFLNELFAAADTSKNLDIIQTESITRIQLSRADGEECISADALLDKGYSYDMLLCESPSIDASQSGRLKLSYDKDITTAEIFLFNNKVNVVTQSMTQSTMTFIQFKDVFLKKTLGNSYNQALADNYKDNNYYSYLYKLNSLLEKNGTALDTTFKNFIDYNLYTIPVTIKKGIGLKIDYTIIADDVELPAFRYFAPLTDYFSWEKDELKVTAKNFLPYRGSGFKRRGGIFKRNYALSFDYIYFHVSDYDYFTIGIYFYTALSVLLLSIAFLIYRCIAQAVSHLIAKKHR